MILLDAENIRKNYGDETVLDGVTFDIRAGDRISLVGPNGSGKTTLMRIIAGQEEADAGEMTLHRSVHVGYLEQQPDFPTGRTLWQQAETAMGDLIMLQEEALSVAEEMAHDEDEQERARLAARYDHLQQELSRRDGYNIRHKIERVLCGLGFTADAFDRPVETLSGGEQNRLMLAGLLLSEPNLMLLDEPSNHLDIEATEWLEDFLLDSSAAMLLVSHDRRFLDKVADRTLELLHGTVDDYAGNYSAYKRQKAERLVVQQRTYEKQQTEIAKTEEFIRRHSYGQKHAQAEDRRKKLARIVRVDLPRTIDTPAMMFAPVSRSGDIVLQTEGLSKSYDEPLFEDVSIQIERGQRWGLIGPNGSGKTTLLRCLLGQIPPDRGTVNLGVGVKVGYFDQHLAELDDHADAVDAIRPPRREMFEQQRRDLLARFGLTGDVALRPVGVLSGGQRCRTALARLSAAGANFLVLDEPTNHLDLWARDGLEEALERFDGTVLFVSHDRYFVDRVADHLLVIEPGRIRVVEGGYQSYKLLLRREQEEAKRAAAAGGSKVGVPGGGSRGEGGRESAKSKRKRRFPYRKLEDVEADIFSQEKRLEELHLQLSQGETQRDGARAKRVAAEIEECNKAIARLYEHWEEAAELNW